MKPLKILSMLVLSIALMMGCVQDETLIENQDDLMLKKASKAPTVVVEPTGVDDTENLKNAFADAMTAGSGAVVQLCEGEYFLGFIEVRDFNGTLKGAGKGKTVITALKNLDAQALWDNNQFHDLLKFVGGEVHLSHFSIQTPEGKLCTTGPPAGHIRNLINFSATNAVYEPMNTDREISVFIDNVAFKGQYLVGGPGYNFGYNCFFAIGATYDWMSGTDVPREKINFKITNSDFDTFCYGLILQSMTDCEVIVGEKSNGNTFTKCDHAGGVWESRNLSVIVEGNTFNIPNSSGGFHLDINTPWYPLLQDSPQEKATICKVQHNVFNLNKSFIGLWMKDFRRRQNPDEMPVMFLVKNNKFNMAEGWGNAMRCRWTQGVVIRNNIIRGFGNRGITIDSPGGNVYNENGLLLGNNFSNAEFKSTTIFLSPDTRNWTIVGGHIGQDVIDKGENNLITGMNVNMSDVPLGQTISDNLKEMKSPMHDLK